MEWMGIEIWGFDKFLWESWDQLDKVPAAMATAM
jgi:hypothetical protein